MFLILKNLDSVQPCGNMTIRKASLSPKKHRAAVKHSIDESWDDRIAFWATLFVSMLAYQSTVSPSISGGDAGELVAEGCALGTAHPPGYPLYIVIVFLVTSIGRLLLPEDYTKAWMVNTTSCLFGSLASAFLTSSILLLLNRGNVRKNNNSSRSNPRVIDAVAAVTMGILHTSSPLTWQYSTTSEVFALHNLFVALIVHATIRYAVKPCMSNYLKGAFICGFALTNQHTSILLSLPLILWVICVTKLYSPKQVATTVHGQTAYLLLMASGIFLSSIIAFYATLPIFSNLYHHAGSWGDVTSLSGFINHIRRKDYGTLRLFSGNDAGSEGMLRRTVLWAQDFVFCQGKPLVALFFLVGCVEVVRAEYYRRVAKRRFQSTRRSMIKIQTVKGFCSNLKFDVDGPGVDTAILCSLILYLVVFHYLSNLPLNNNLFFGVHQRFWMHPNLLCFVLAGVGLSHSMNMVYDRCPDVRYILILTPLLVSTHTVVKGIADNDQGNNYHFHNYASSILSTLPKNALLLINYDQQWTSVRYLQECEGIRNDVTSIHLGMMSYEWWKQKRGLYPTTNFPGPHYSNTGNGFTFSEFIMANYDTPNGIFLGGHPSFSDPNYDRDFEEIPHGIVNRIVKKRKSTINHETYRRKTKYIWNIVVKAFDTHQLPEVSKYGPVTWESTIVREFYDHFVLRATHLLHLAVEQVENQSNLVSSLAEACAWLEIARLNDKVVESSPSVWKNLGIGYMHLVRSKEKKLPPLTELLNQNITKHFPIDISSIWWDGKTEWKTWASHRWRMTWGRYLQMEDAKIDNSYDSVKSIYDKVMEITRPDQRGVSQVESP